MDSMGSCIDVIQTEQSAPSARLNLHCADETPNPAADDFPRAQPQQHAPPETLFEEEKVRESEHMRFQKQRMESVKAKLQQVLEPAAPGEQQRVKKKGGPKQSLLFMGDQPDVEEVEFPKRVSNAGVQYPLRGVMDKASTFRRASKQQLVERKDLSLGYHTMKNKNPKRQLSSARTYRDNSEAMLVFEQQHSEGAAFSDVKVPFGDFGLSSQKLREREVRVDNLVRGELDEDSFEGGGPDAGEVCDMSDVEGAINNLPEYRQHYASQSKASFNLGTESAPVL